MRSLPFAFQLLVLAAALFPVAEAQSIQEDGCIARWIFDSSHVHDGVIEEGISGLDAAIKGPAALSADPGLPALLINQRENQIEAPAETAAKVLPQEQITVEAWVSVDKTAEWASIIGQVSDNKGWSLGYRQSNFSFGVSGQTTGGLTHVRNRDSLEWGRWYHVVGTYDGREIKVYVNGRLENSSSEQTGNINYPENTPIRMGTREDFYGRLWVNEVALYSRALPAGEIQDRFEKRKASFPQELRLKLGPVLTRLDANTVRIVWDTEQPCPTSLSYGEDAPPSKVVEDPAPKTHHETTLSGLADQTIHYYRIRFRNAEGKELLTRIFEYDATLDYATLPRQIEESPFPADPLLDRYVQAAEEILAKSGVKKGYCLVLGSGEGRLAYEIAKRSQLTVVCIEEDEAKVAASRKLLDQAGAYGSRITLQQGQIEKLPFPDYIFNLVVSDSLLVNGELPSAPSELYRVLRPCGGVLCMGGPSDSAPAPQKIQDWLTGFPKEEASLSKERGCWGMVRRGALAGAGEWTHQYADASNSANSLDSLVQGGLSVLWFGRPGPRPMLDRGTRSPAPLSTHGYLYVQGDRHLFGLDAYNGTLLWALNIPELRRANVPRDGSNMTAAPDALYVAVREACWKLSPDTGEIESVFQAAPGEDRDSYDWGYMACQGDFLLGSAVRHGALFIGADGEWYDRNDEESFKVTSDVLFALDRHTGERRWEYRKGLIINPTLSASDDAIYFIETRNPAALAMDARRFGDDIFASQYMVALDPKTGKTLWEKPVQFEGGSWVFYMLYAKDTLVILSTTDKYHLHAFDAKNGEQLWEQHYNWRRDNHGGSMQHPVIVGDVVYGEPSAFDLRSGRVVRETIPQRDKCGTMSGCANALVFRDHYHSIWDLATDKWTQLEGVRSGCWLSIIPAGGIVLAPEASSGCFCTHPIQTSMAFLPVKANP
jgi:outer membrane protein assembly factor BamB